MQIHLSLTAMSFSATNLICVDQYTCVDTYCECNEPENITCQDKQKH